MRPTLRPQGRNPVPPRGTGLPPPVPRPGGGRAGSSWGAFRPPSSPAWAQAPRPSAVAAAGRGSLRPSLSRAPLCCLGLVWGRVCPPPFFATSRLAGGSGAVPCRAAASPLSWSVPVVGSPSLPALRAAAAAPVAPFRPCPPAFPPVPAAAGLGRAVSRRCKPSKPVFSAAGSPPLCRGVLPPLVLGFALPPFAPPSRGVGALCGAGSPCVLRVGRRVPPGALALRASGGRALRAPGLCGGLRPRFLRPAPALFRRVRARGDACRGWPGVFLCRSGWRGCVPRLGVVPLRAGAGQLCAPHSVRKGGVYAPIPPAPFPVGKGGRKADGLPCGGYHGGAGVSRASGLAGACAPLDTPYPHDVG